MKNYKLSDKENEFAHLLWDNVPISTRRLVEVCEDLFKWKRTTTYTMLKRLCVKGIFENANGTVVARIKKEDFFADKGEQFLINGFNGSLPKFLTAFMRRKTLSDSDIKEIQKIINEHNFFSDKTEE